MNELSHIIRHPLKITEVGFVDSLRSQPQVLCLALLGPHIGAL